MQVRADEGFGHGPVAQSAQELASKLLFGSNLVRGDLRSHG